MSLLYRLRFSVKTGRKQERGLTSLVQRPQTASTDVHPAHLVVDLDAHALDIGPELAAGGSLGMADVMSEPNTLATYITFRHGSPRNRL